MLECQPAGSRAGPGTEREHQGETRGTSQMSAPGPDPATAGHAGAAG